MANRPTVQCSVNRSRQCRALAIATTTYAVVLGSFSTLTCSHWAHGHRLQCQGQASRGHLADRWLPARLTCRRRYTARNRPVADDCPWQEPNGPGEPLVPSTILLFTQAAHRRFAPLLATLRCSLEKFIRRSRRIRAVCRCRAGPGNARQNPVRIRRRTRSKCRNQRI